MKKFQEHLRSIAACKEARHWAKNLSAKQAWETCERADWLLRWAARTSINSHQAIALVACEIARTALKFVPAGELRPLQAIEAAELWIKEPTEDNLRACLQARRAAAAAAAAAYAAAYAADGGGGAVAARLKAQKENCEIVRKSLQQPFLDCNTEAKHA